MTDERQGAGAVLSPEANGVLAQKEEQTMKRFLLATALAATALWTASAQEVTTPIPILNAGFEADVLTCAPGGNCFNTAVPGWLPAWLPGGFAGTIKPGTAQYPGGVPGGVNVGFLGNGAQNRVIFQTLGATVQANTVYILKLSVGHRLDEAFTGYLATLLAGSVTVASDDTLNPAAGTFLEDVIVYESGPTPALLGQLLAISIRSIGTGQVNIDNCVPDGHD
jgi:hypothetical protein